MSNLIVNFEHELLLRILSDREFREVVRNKITSDFFYDPDHREVFNYLQSEYTTHGAVPSVGLVQENYPEFEYYEPQDSIGLLCDQVRKKKLYNDVGSAVEKIQVATRGDPEEGLRLLKEQAASLTATHSVGQDVDVTKVRQEVLNEYKTIKKADGLLGIPYPWDRLNQRTLGMHAGEFIIYYARPKSLKTWLLLYTALYAHNQMGKVPVIMTKEMPADQLRRRVVALYCGLDYTAYREGKLTAEEEKNFELDLEAFEEAPPFLICDCTSTGVEALTEFRSKLEEYNADIGFFDGVYFLGEDWKELTQITRGFKSLAKEMRIPIIGTTQANRTAEKSKGESLSEISYGDSFGQDADVIIRILRDAQQIENNELILTLPGFREGPGCTFTINAFPAKDFTQKAVVDEGDHAIQGLEDGVIMPDDEETEGRIE